jgi:predicted hydrocarbon binding protein
MRKPKDVLVWEYAPGRKLAEFLVEVKNTKGALAGCAQALAHYNINLLSGFHTAPSSSTTGTWSFFADVTESTSRPEEIAESLRSLPFVGSVEIYGSQDGFLVDDKHFPVRWAGRRVMMMRTEAETEMIARLWDVFGTGAVTIIDEMGEAMGRFTAREIVSDFGRDFVVKNLVHFLKTYTALGIADIEVKSYDQGEGAVVLEASELFECAGKPRLNTAKKSVFFGGHLRGFMSTIFDAPFEAVETECLSTGGKVCRFQVSKLLTASQRITSRVDKSR